MRGTFSSLPNDESAVNSEVAAHFSGFAVSPVFANSLNAANTPNAAPQGQATL
jgi:hypothetical protein